MSFIGSSNFDTSTEPTIDDSYRIKQNNITYRSNQKKIKYTTINGCLLNPHIKILIIMKVN